MFFTVYQVSANGFEFAVIATPTANLRSTDMITELPIFVMEAIAAVMEYRYSITVGDIDLENVYKTQMEHVQGPVLAVLTDGDRISVAE